MSTFYVARGTLVACHDDGRLITWATWSGAQRFVAMNGGTVTRVADLDGPVSTIPTRTKPETIEMDPYNTLDHYRVPVKHTKAPVPEQVECPWSQERVTKDRTNEDAPAPAADPWSLAR